MLMQRRNERGKKKNFYSAKILIRALTLTPRSLEITCISALVHDDCAYDE